MRNWIKKHQAFVAVQVSLLALSLLLLGAFWLFGERIVRSGYEERSIAFINSLYHPVRPLPFSAVFGQATRAFHGVLTVVLGLQVLVFMLGVAASARRRRLALPAAFVLWWLAAEVFAAPHLVDLFRLRNYRFIQDVDHRPTNTSGGSNSDAVRGAPESSEFRDADLSVLFLGDSFTFGLRVNAGQAFPYVIQRRLQASMPDVDLRVANFGWTSSSPLLSYRRLVDIGDDYEPDFVVMCLDMTDFGDDVRYQNMLDQRGIYWLYDKTPLLLKLVQVASMPLYKQLLGWTAGHPPGDRFFISAAPLEETREWFRPLMHNVTRVHEWCRARDAQFMLVVLPRNYQYSDRESPTSVEWERYTALGPYALEPFRFFDEVRGGVDYPILSLLEDFQQTDVFPTCFEDDPHWNPEGHGVAAQAILRHLEPRLRAWVDR
ncbi:MAG: hypothetical protein ACI8QZ_004207 [Chlamydiales bacterium]|jgi:hypothetical protein